MLDLPDVHRTGLTRRLQTLGYAAALMVVLLSCMMIARAIWRRSFFFDDAFVYWRYAQNFQHGMGLVWNAGEAPAHGVASPLWCLIVLPFIDLPVTAATALQLSSWFTGIAALVLLAVSVSRNASSAILQSVPLALGAVGLPLLVSTHFAYQLTTGTDTMLSLLTNVLLILVMLEYCRAPTLSRALLTSVVAFVAILGRSENLLCSLAVPGIAWYGFAGKRRWTHLAALLLPNLLLLGAYLLCCEHYFGQAWPTDFLGKSLDAFRGFMGAESSLSYLFATLLCLVPFIGLLGAMLKCRRDWTIAALLVPAAATMLGLVSGRQHMGFEGRFYMPYVAYVVMAALLCLDAGLTADAPKALRRGAAGIAVACLVFAVSIPLQRYANREFMGWRAARPSTVPSLQIAASTVLPATDWQATLELVGQSIARLPPQVVLAAAEIGYAGYASPHRTIIDLTGINDADISMHGFNTDRLMQRSPDIIWLPPLDYTGLRAALLSNQRFIADYRIIAGAFNDGLAIRRDGAFRADIDREVKTAWNLLYPERQIGDYIVRETSAD